MKTIEKIIAFIKEAFTPIKVSIPLSTEETRIVSHKLFQFSPKSNIHMELEAKAWYKSPKDWMK